ncbi:3,4-dihydroxy-2-butanone-4-phosphate synthase [Nocardia sp. CA-290969]|uniref:3,4-dihydroxy-2-butanone-4-phosphate synthase n=1 Tax=Nocardia sp. CA-290969 TaxID=3239986 RepID=UPI003D93F889
MSDGMHRVECAAADLAAGKTVVLVGYGSQGSDGYLVVAAEKATTHDVAFMVRHTAGFVCAAVTDEICARAGLPLLSGTFPASGHDFTVSVDAASGVTTGISAADRAATVRRLADPASDPTDFTRPGHVVPVLVHSNGVLGRRRAAEAAVDLLRAAGLHEAGALAALVSDTEPTGIAGPAQSRAFAAEHRMNWVSIADIVNYRRSAEPLARQTFRVVHDTPYGAIEEIGYPSDTSDVDLRAYRAAEVARILRLANVTERTATNRHPA